MSEMISNSAAVVVLAFTARQLFWLRFCFAVARKHPPNVAIRIITAAGKSRRL